MSMRLKVWALAGAVLFLAGAATARPAAAQFQVTPFFTSYYPIGSLGEVSGIEALQVQGLGGGLALGYMFSDVMGLELTGAYVLSDAYVRACNFDPVNFPGLCLTSENLSGYIMLGDLALKFRPRGTNFFLLIGPSIQNRGGDAWSGATGTTTFGGMGGLGVTARVAPKFALDIRAEAHMYSFDPDGDGTSFDSKFRTDVLLKVGVPIPSR